MPFPSLAPIAIFAYRRTDHLERTLDALEACPEFASSRVFVFSDGPKSDAAAPDVTAVRQLIHARKRSNMSVIEAPSNQGLAASVIAGVSRLCNDYGRVIVIEDDLVVSPLTLTWLNAGLGRYADDENVYQISAYQWWNPLLDQRMSGLFGQMAVSWGWATWKRAWDRFDPEARGWDELQENRTLRRAFEMDGTYPMAEMLELQANGPIDSWAIRWAWTVFRNDGLVLYPPRTLVTNIGFDETGTNNSIGRLKQFTTRRPAPWQHRTIPTMPPHAALDAHDLRVFQSGLRWSGAMRNRRIVAVLRALGLWRKN